MQETAVAPPEPIGSPLAAYKATRALIDRLGARKILDCPAGRGAFAWELLQAGYDVTCADIEPDQFQAGIHCSLADLNDALPYRDAEFDVVTCQNGLHRVWARGRALRELARVTKPGGHVVFTFVNNNNLWRRLVFLLSGSVAHDVNGPPHNFYPDAANPAACFRYSMSVAQVASAMASVGLKIVELTALRISAKSVLLAPLAALPLAFSLAPPRGYREHGFLKQADSFAALFGDYLLICGRKD